MMLARNSKRLLAMLMAMVMCLSLVSIPALATEYVVGSTYTSQDPDAVLPKEIPAGTHWSGPVEHKDLTCNQDEHTHDKATCGYEEVGESDKYDFTEQVMEPQTVYYRCMNEHHWLGDLHIVHDDSHILGPCKWEEVDEDAAGDDEWFGDWWYDGYKCGCEDRPVTHYYAWTCGSEEHTHGDTCYTTTYVWTLVEDETPVEPGDPLVAQEYHFVDISAFEQYCLEKLGVTSNRIWGVSAWDIVIYDKDGNHTTIPSGPNYVYDIYNVNAATSLTGDYIQKEDISQIEVTMVWMQGLSLHTETAIFNANEFTYSEVKEPTFGLLNFVEVYCQPQTQKHTVTLDANGGSFTIGGETVTTTEFLVDDGDQLVEKDLPTPTRIGDYTFEGWYQDAEGNTPWKFDTAITQDNVTLYAKWKEGSSGTQESSYVRFYIEDMNNAEYNLTGIPGTGNLKVDQGFVYLDSIQVKGLEGGQPVTDVAAWMNQYGIAISANYDTVAELVAAANDQKGNNLNENDYADFDYTNVTWEGSESDNAYHVHIKLNKKSNETGTLYISKSVAGLATVPGVPDDYNVTITVTAKGADKPSYTLNKANATPGKEGKWFEWKLENVPVGEYTVKETAYSDNFQSGDYTYQLKETEITDNGVVNVTANGESWVAVTNTYARSSGPIDPTPTDKLYFSKRVNYTSAKVGDELTYTIQVHNGGSQAANVTITDKLAGGLTYVSADNGAQYEKTTNTVSWTGTVAANATLDLKIVAKIKDDQAGKTITNVATVNGKETSPVKTQVDSATEPTPTEPEKPSVDDLNALLNVVVDCTSDTNHADKTYENLLADSYTVGDVKDSKCTVTIQAAEYVKAYGGDHSVSGDDAKTVNLVYSNGWKLADGSANATVTFAVICGGGSTTPPTTPPTTPGGGGDDDDGGGIIVTVNPRPTTDPDVDLPDPTTPLGPGTDDGSGDKDEGGTDVDLPDGETPLGNLPQTGAVAAPVNPATTAGLVALAFSMAGCGLYFTFGRKKGEEED